MAYDKVVDSAQLDGAMTSTANAIRAKNGGSGGIQWDAATGFADAVAAISSGGAVQESDINFWDYDGTLLYAWTLAELAGKTELPPLPSHDGLVCQGWNWTLQDIKDAGRELDIGALYVTDDGKTRLYVDVDTETWDDFVLNYWQSNANATTVDWGDGTTPESKAQESSVEHRHTYAASGRYMITMTVAEGKTVQLGKGGGTLLSESVNSPGRQVMLIKAEIGAGITNILASAFYMCLNMESLTVPGNVTLTMSRLFDSAYKIRMITAGAMTTINQAAYYAINLKVFASPKGAVQTGGYAIAFTPVRRVNFDIVQAVNAFGLERAHLKAVNGTVNGGRHTSVRDITVPADATALGAAAFIENYNLRKVTCLGDIASVSAQAFQYCYALRYVDFTHCTAVPTLANVNAFGSTHSQLEIRVPASLADAWKAATNWSSLADQIVGVSAE